MEQKLPIIEELLKRFPEDRLTYQKSVSTFHPENANEAADIVTLANEQKQSLSITGFGNNIDPIGEQYEKLLAIKTDRLNQLIEIAPQDFYVKVGAGYPLRELSEHLKSEGLYFPHAELPYVGSVGGAIATNLTADHQGHELPIKRHLIEATVVMPHGEIITPGSVCFKSVSGYDIVKIFAPSWGLLGLIVSATFRVHPMSAAEEYSDIKMRKTDRSRFFNAFDKNNKSAESVYNKKIKNKFDPHTVLPLLAIK